MTTLMRSALGVLLAVSVGGFVLRATEPAAPRTTGRILILENERTLEGAIERHGDLYRVRRAVGETLVPREKVLCLCDSREEAYLYLRARANLNDGDERRRLAQWCLTYGLRDQALVEATAAVDLRPNDKESQRLLRGLQRAAAATDSTARPADKPEHTPTLQPAIDLNTESMSLFVTRIQPILMNACANCHAAGKGGGFGMTRAADGALIHRRTTQQNAAAVLAQLNPAQPAASPLLIKAVSVHGDGSQPPLKGKQSVAYRTLEDWVQRTIANHPQMHAQVTEPKNRGDAPAPKLQSAEALKPAREESTFASEPGRRGAEKTLPEQPRESAKDPFDPALFNRQAFR